jgi:hypothetical protein
MDINNEHRLTEVEERSKSNTHRIDELERRQNNVEKLATSVEVLAIQQNSLKEDIGEIKTDVRSMASKPAKRWESVVEKIIITVVVAVVAFLLAKVGL